MHVLKHAYILTKRLIKKKYILTKPLGQQPEHLKELTADAKRLAKAFDTMSAIGAREALESKIAESLDEGGAWPHKFAKQELIAPSQF